MNKYDMNIEIILWFASAYDFYLFTSKRTSHEVICLLYECKYDCRDTEYLILTDNKHTSEKSK